MRNYDFFLSYVCDFKFGASFESFVYNFFIHHIPMLVFYAISSKFYRQYFTIGNGVVGFTNFFLCILLFGGRMIKNINHWKINILFSFTFFR